MRCVASTLAFVVLALAGCGGPAAAPAASSPAAAASLASSAVAKPSAAAPAASGAKLTVSHSQVSADQMVLWDAKEGGVFDKNGLNVDVRLIESSTGLSALLGGDVDISALGGSEAMAAAASGADVIIAANLMPVYTFKLEVPASIQKPEDLIGKKLGVTRAGSTTDTGTRDSLRKVGLVPDKDVSIVQLGASKQATYAGLTNGTVQGILMQPPDTLAAEKQGFHPLYDLAHLDLPAAAAVIVTQRSWAAAHKDVMQKFMDSLVQATAREKKDAAFGQAVLKRNFKLEDDEAVKAGYDYFSGIHPSYPYPKIEQFSSIIANIKQQNPNAKDFDFAKTLDPSFVKSAEDRGLANS
jgi:NitT/TauT family transport system substrate-binding protein